MHPKKIGWAIAALLVIATAAAAAETKDAAPSSKESAEIRAALDGWAKAMHNRDMAGIMALYDPAGVTAYDIVPPLQYAGYDAYKKDYEQFLAQYKGPIDTMFRDLTVIADENIAFAYGIERISGVLTDGTKSEVWMRVTSCFHKVGGRWLDVHDHVSVPTDMTTGKAMLALVP